MYTYTATDTYSNTAPSDSGSLVFSITVEADTAPAFADGAMIPEQIYTQNTMITPLTFPRATGGNGDFILYVLHHSTPLSGDFGLTLNSFTGVLTGTPTTAATVMTYILLARDADSDTDSLTFTITVNADTTPAFAAGAAISAQIYMMGTAITPLTLPAVETPGNGATTYALTPAIPGLTLDAATGVLTGTPTTVAT